MSEVKKIKVGRKVRVTGRTGKVHEGKLLAYRTTLRGERADIEIKGVAKPYVAFPSQLVAI